MVSGSFQQEYDLDSLQLIRPPDQSFEMEVTPYFLHYYAHNRHEAFTADFVANALSSHSLFIDVGAHYGFYTLLAARHSHLAILSIEPVPENYSILLRNIARNDLHNVQTRRVAVSDRDGRRRLQKARTSDTCSFYPHPLSPPIGEIEVETATIDALLANQTPCRTFIKVDTDGHELAVLDGMRDTLSRFPDISLVLELNPKMLALAGHSPEELLSALTTLGFDVYFLNDRQRLATKMTSPSAWRHVMDPISYINAYCPRKARSLSLCFFAHSSALAGAERSLLELVAELIQDHGCICTVVLPAEGPLSAALGHAGAACLYVSFSWWCSLSRLTEGEVDAILRQSILTLFAGPLQIIRDVNPDMVATFTMVIPWGAVVASLLKKPHVWHICEHGQPDSALHFFFPFEEVLKTIRNSSVMLFTASHALKRALFPDVPESECSTLYRHIRIPTYTPDTTQETYYRRSGALRLGMFANLCEGKGQQDAVLAVAELVRRGHDVELLLVGDALPDYRDKLVRLSIEQAVQERIRMTGFVEHVYAVMRETDIVLVCSRYEAFGRVAVEGMLLDKPVIYPSGSHFEYMIDGETGLAYTPGDPQQLADRIESLAARPDLRRTLVMNGAALARSRFTRHDYGGKFFRAVQGLRGCGPCPISERLHALIFAVIEDRVTECEAAMLESARNRAAYEAALRELSDLRNTFGWKLLDRYWRTVHAAFPPGTRRRWAYDIPFRAVGWLNKALSRARARSRGQ